MSESVSYEKTAVVAFRECGCGRAADLDGDKGFIDYYQSIGVRMRWVTPEDAMAMVGRCRCKKSIVPDTVMRMLRDQSITLGKVGSDVMIQCKSGDDARNVFDWLAEIQSERSPEQVSKALTDMIGHRIMILCETCGNKRCPHATDTNLECTGSNEPGQKGSRYE